MRDLLVTLIVLGSLPMAFVRPYVGVLVYYWLSLMNPHRLTWGFAQQMRVALLVTAGTVLGWIVSREKTRLPRQTAVVMLVAFAIWITITTIFAELQDDAWDKWSTAIKIFFMTFVAMCLINSRERINQLIWVAAVSLGFYGFRGGIFTILTGGNHRVFGPPDTFIGDNNQLALALVMTIPLMRYLQTTTTKRWVKLGLWAAMGCTVIAVVGTYSRGGFLALLIMLAYFWWKTPAKVVSGAAMALIALAVVVINPPQQWVDRMASIGEYEQDQSAQGRFQAWTFAWKVATDRPITGGGFRVFASRELYARYVPEVPSPRNAHSIYFEVLGEQGFFGLALFLILFGSTFVSAMWVIRRSRGDPELDWANNLAAMIQVSLVGYAIAGAFLNLGIFDLAYLLIALIVMTRQCVEDHLKAKVPAEPVKASERQAYAHEPALAPPLRERGAD